MLWKFIMFYPIVGRVALAVSVLSVSGLASAFERDHDAHEHGHATLTVVQEGHDLHLSFNSPAMDIVGFEHAPSNDAERVKIANAKETLEDAKRMFVVGSASECEIEKISLKSALLEHKTESGHHEHDHHEDDHHDDHQKHDDHDDHHEHGDHDDHHGHEKHDEEHSEFEATYVYHCDKPEALEEVTVNVFGLFPSLEELETQVITAKGQRLIELNKSSNSFEL